MIEVVFEDADGRGNPWIRCSAAELPEALERHPNAVSLADDAIEQMKLPSGGNVRHLELETPNLRSMSGLDSWQELLVLKMNDTKITLLDCILGLDRLGGLSLDGLILEDLTPLTRLPRLTGVSLQRSIVADWQPLAEMRLLGALSASWSNLVRLNEVVQPLLGSVGAAGSGVRDLSNLGCNTNISSLSLSACSIETLSGLDQAPRLDYLTLREVHCNDFSGLIQAPNLRKLELAGSNFRDLSLLARCPALKQVSVRGCTLFGWEALLDARPCEIEAPPRSIDKKMIKALEAAGHVIRERQYPNRTDPPRSNPGW